MKIYFEDGRLMDIAEINSDIGYIMIDAYYGFTHCYDKLMKYKDDEKLSGINIPIYTNFSAALNNKFAWNKELQVPEIYLRKNGNWVRIDELTDRELREGHNIEKMWITGAFE